MIKKCKICGTKFETDNKKKVYCSAKCNAKAYRLRNPERYKKLTTEFRKRHRKERNRKNRKYELKERTCQYCKKKFMPDRNHPLAKFCSHKCRCAYNWYNKYRKEKTKAPLPEEREEKECKVCGKLFKPKGTFHPHQIYCSVKCSNKVKQKKYYDTHREDIIAKRTEWGRQNPQKRNDYARAAHFKRKSKIKESKFYLSAKKQAFIRERDNHKCVYCHQPGRTLEHIIPIERGGLDRVNNVVVACFNCNCSKQHKFLEDWLKSKYCERRSINKNTINPVVWKLLKEQDEQQKLEKKNKPFNT